MSIVIIGASGLIGRNLFNIISEEGRSLIGTYQSRKIDGLVHYDMRHQDIQAIVPHLSCEDTVYLLSAYSNPSWIFTHEPQARELNLIATKRLIDQVNKAGARVIFMSSVEIFDGKSGNYKEGAVPHPLNLYGKMKLEIEKYLINSSGKYCIVRTGWNVGLALEDRCVVKLTYETLVGPDAKMANDNMFSIIDVKDTARGLLRLSENKSITICHLSSNPPVVRSRLADMVISFSKFKNLMHYEAVKFSDIPYSEPRGRLNHLDNSLAIRELSMEFTPSEEVIRRKVEYLDEKMEKGDFSPVPAFGKIILKKVKNL